MAVVVIAMEAADIVMAEVTAVEATAAADTGSELGFRLSGFGRRFSARNCRTAYFQRSACADRFQRGEAFCLQNLSCQEVPFRPRSALMPA